MKFIDQAVIKVKAGDGGHGCIAFHREKFVPKGGPSGGDGGNGGNVIIKSNHHLSTLQDVTYRSIYKAERGQHGMGKNMRGRKGKDIVIEVPPGTISYDIKEEKILCDLTSNDQEVIVAKGGKGGFGNARFKTRNITAPRIANDGQKGEEREIELELKVLADVGLVGFPNAGKSTFLARISAAAPKIADYPFTTLTPNLGIVKSGNFSSFVMADIPGLIEGASSGKGLGVQFLRHIERTKILVFLIDSTSDDPDKEYEVLLTECKKHNAGLEKKLNLVFLTKADIFNDSHEISKFLKQHDTFSFSSVTGKNVDLAIQKIASNLEKLNDTQIRNTYSDATSGDRTL